MKKLTLILCCLCLFVACEENDDILDYSKARACLDKITVATKTDAKACVSSLASDTSPRAYKLRCASDFLSIGLSTSKLASIFANLQEDSSNKMNEMMTQLHFTGDTGADAVDNAELAFDNCNASKSTGMAMLGSFAYSATLMANLTGWDGHTLPIDLTTNIDVANSSDAQLGAAVLNIQNVYCNLESADEKLCAQINDIIGNSTDPNTIGDQFRHYVSQ